VAHPKGTTPTTASVITDPLPTGGPPSSVAPDTDPKPTADLPSTEATPTANPPVSPESIPGSPQSPLKKFSPSREVGDRHPSEGPDPPRLEYSPPAPSKFDRVDREPEPSKEISPQGILDFTKLVSLLDLNHTSLRVCPWLSTLRVNLVVFRSCLSYSLVV
jgi:hypothetical protein